jgi:hypothetical protein
MKDLPRHGNLGAPGNSAMYRPLEQLNREIARRKADLIELESTANSLRMATGTPRADSRISGVVASAKIHDPLDLVGLPIREAARIIATEAGDWIDYRDMARRALLRGYRSRTLFADPGKTARSFFDIMRRNAAYERKGSTFRLIQ